MNLTKDDLKAIKSLIDASNETLAIQAANGFAEVHEKLTGLGWQIKELSDKHDVRDGKLQNTVERVDALELRFNRLKPKTV